MRLQLLPILFFSLVHIATAQKIPRQVDMDTLSFLVSARDQHMFLELKSPLEGINLQKSISGAVTEISLLDADLIVAYTPALLSRGLTHLMECRLTDRSGATISPDQYSTKTIVDEKGQHQFIWMDATETPLIFGQEYVLYITVSLLGPVDCAADRPAFTLKQKLPYYAVGIAGLSAIGVGYGLNAQKKNAYREYADKWAKGDTESAAQNDLRSAKDKKRQAEIMIYSGLAILTIDALLWSMRNVKTKREQRRFDRYCIQPARIGFTPVQGNNKLQHSVSPGYGLQLTYGF